MSGDRLRFSTRLNPQGFTVLAYIRNPRHTDYDWAPVRVATDLRPRCDKSGEYLEWWDEDKRAATMDAPEYMPAGSMIGYHEGKTTPRFRTFSRSVDCWLFETNDHIYQPS